MPYSPDLGRVSRWLMDNPTAYRPYDPNIREIDQAILRRLSGSLKRAAASDQEGAGALLRRLGRCSRRDACASSACPNCTRRVQGWFSDAILEVARENGRTTLSAVTIVPSGDVVPREKLGLVELEMLKGRLKRRLSGVDAHFLVGIIEIELAEHEDERYPASWVPHLHGVIAGDDMKKISRQLRARFPSSELVPKPVVIRNWDGGARWPSYCFKLGLWRRVASDKVKRIDHRTGEPRWCHGTKQRRLRAAETVALMLYLAQYSIEDRFITHGCHLTGRQNNELRVRVSRRADAE